jgi:hypothetical protein
MRYARRASSWYLRQSGSARSAVPDHEECVLDFCTRCVSLKEAGDSPSTIPTLLGQPGDLNNHRAWDTLVERYKPLIERWCRQQGVEPADMEDVSARILAKLMESMIKFRYDTAHR